MSTFIHAAGAIGIALLLGSGCTPPAATATPRLAVVTTAWDMGHAGPSSGPRMHVHRTRVLTSKVNLQEPLQLGVQGGEVTVTVAMRGHRGWTFALDPQALGPTSVTPYDYEDHPQRVHPGCQLVADARITLHDNRTVAFRTDEATNVVVAQIFDAEGNAVGPESTASGPTNDVIGAPRAVTIDGHHVVIAYFAASETGFDLVATSLEAP